MNICIACQATSLTCEKCGGLGVVLATDPWGTDESQPCGECGATGRCNSCSGKGINIAGDACSECKEGKGKCRVCGGTGQLINRENVNPTIEDWYHHGRFGLSSAKGTCQFTGYEQNNRDMCSAEFHPGDLRASIRAEDYAGAKRRGYSDREIGSDCVLDLIHDLRRYETENIPEEEHSFGIVDQLKKDTPEGDALEFALKKRLRGLGRDVTAHELASHLAEVSRNVAVPDISHNASVYDGWNKISTLLKD